MSRSPRSTSVRQGTIVVAGLFIFAVPASFVTPVGEVSAAELSATVKRIKPGIVGIGTYQKTRRPPARLMGTGFAIGGDRGDRYVVTAAHVIRAKLNKKNKEYLAILVGTGRNISVRAATVAAADDDRDVALLQYNGSRLHGLDLADDGKALEGQAIAFTGFPIGAVLGLYPVTHRGIISAITPIAVPLRSGRRLDIGTIRRLKDNFRVFQLDATAYPGNSGSPVYGASSGRVLGVISSVYVKKTKERILQEPSGITYAIPIRYVRALLAKLTAGN